MKVITVTNQRGGVGKSTTSWAVGQELRRRGYKVLFVDLDAQGNLSYTLGADIRGYNATGVLERPETAREEIQHTPSGDIIASSPKLAVADKLLDDTGKEHKLKEALETIRGEYDYIIIDTPPALGILTINALTASTGAIIPAQADMFSLQGIIQLNNTVETVKKYCNPSLSIMGIVLTRYNPRTTIRREIAGSLRQVAEQIHTKLYNTNIRECVAIVEAEALKIPLFEYAPRSNATADYTALVDEILQDERG